MPVQEESTREWCAQYTDNPPEFGPVYLEKNQTLADLRRYIIDWWDAEIIPNNSQRTRSTHQCLEPYL